MANGPFVMSEQQVALRLGVPTEWVRERRRGGKGTLWDRTGGGPILWTEAAVSELEKALVAENAPAVSTLENGSASPRGQDGLAPATENGWVRLIVQRTGFPNHRILHAFAPGAPDQLATVWVRDSGRFATGISILALPWPGRPGVFTFAGNPEKPEAGPREPRRKGVW